MRPKPVANTNSHRRRLLGIFTYLMIWIASFVAGFLLTSINLFYLLLISLFDSAIIFLAFFIVWWLFQKRTVGKIVVALVILLFAIYAYEDPSSYSINSLENDFFFAEVSFLNSIPISNNFGTASTNSGSPSGPAPINSIQTAVDSSSLYSAYSSNQAQADAKFTGEQAYVSGAVDSVYKASDGHYQSCSLPNQSQCYPYLTGYTIWNWASQLDASRVPLSSIYSVKTFVAKCTINGLVSGNLELDDCIIVSTD